MYKSRTQDKFVLRLPDGLRDLITTLATKNHRSMNSEIIRRLERSLINSDLCTLQAQVIQQLSDRIRELETAAPESGSLTSSTLPAETPSPLLCYQARGTYRFERCTVSQDPLWSAKAMTPPRQA